MVYHALCALALAALDILADRMAVFAEGIRPELIGQTTTLGTSETSAFAWTAVMSDK